MNATDNIRAVASEVDRIAAYYLTCNLGEQTGMNRWVCEQRYAVLNIWADTHSDISMDNFAAALREIAAVGLWPEKDRLNGWAWVYKDGDGFGHTKWTLSMVTIDRIQQALGMMPTEVIMRHISASRAIAALAGVLCRLPQHIRDIVFVPF